MQKKGDSVVHSTSTYYSVLLVTTSTIVQYIVPGASAILHVEEPSDSEVAVLPSVFVQAADV